MSSATKLSEVVSTFKSIANELRRYKINSKDASIRHMLNLIRQNKVTERRYCRPQDYYKFFSQTYLTYLESSRLQAELTAKYFNKGEKSVEESARLVGLKLPKKADISQKKT